MGNYVSCNCSCACINASSQRASAASDSKKKLAKAITVVHSVEERVIEMGGGAPMKVAELMLEYPGHFVVECETDNSTQIAATITTSTTIFMKRATPLPADHEASPGRIYILFPMHRLHTRVAPHECAFYMGLLTSYVNSAHLLLPCSRKKSLHSLMQASSAKVTPLSSLQLEEIPPHDQPANDSNAQIEDEIDLLLHQFCASQTANTTSNAFSKSGSLVRSKSWIPKLETICE